MSYIINKGCVFLVKKKKCIRLNNQCVGINFIRHAKELFDLLSKLMKQFSIPTLYHRLFLIVFALLIGGNYALAQEEECEETTNKKVLKLLEGSKDKGKSAKERYEMLKKATEMDENCLECWMALGRSTYRRCKSGQVKCDNAIKYYTRVIDICPTYHSDPYYYLGAMHYARGEWKEAKVRFEEFLANTGDEYKHARDWEKKHADVEDIMKDVNFFVEFYGNPVPFDPVKVTGVSSSANDEYLPMLTPDNELIYYTRKRNVQQKGDAFAKEKEFLTVSEHKDAGTMYSNGADMPRPFNLPTSGNYGGVTFSVNNKEMYITICSMIKVGNQSYNNCDIFVSKYTVVNGKYRWTEPENLGTNINSESTWESQPSLSGDGNMLIFAKIGPNTAGTDLYYSVRENFHSEWQPAKPLDQVNSPSHDKSPFIHSDSQTLYFSSNGRPGAGGFDVYFTKFNETTKSWSEPKNIGYPINSEEDEVGFLVSTDGRLAYFASRRMQGSTKYDVYAFELHKDARPEKILMVKGEVRDEQGKVVKDAKIELKYAESKTIDEIPVDTVDGQYVAVVKLKNKEDVVMTIKKDGHAFQSKLISPAALDVDTSGTVAPTKSVPTLAESNPETFNNVTPENYDISTPTDTSATKPPAIKTSSPVVVALEDIKVEKIKTGKPFRINDIKYQTSSALLTKEDKAILAEFAIYLTENPDMKVAIHGHTDSKGDDALNLALSMERSFNVKQYLESQGVKGSRLKSQGFGETKPIGDNGTEAGRAKNRRTEFVILSK